MAADGPLVSACWAWYSAVARSNQARPSTLSGMRSGYRWRKAWCAPSTGCFIITLNQNPLLRFWIMDLAPKVLAAVLFGASLVEIATRLALSEGTVRHGCRPRCRNGGPRIGWKPPGW